MIKLSVLLSLWITWVAEAKDQERPLCERHLIPDVYSLNIVQGMTAQKVDYQTPLSSPGVTDPWLKLGRRVVAFPDFKFLSDLQSRNLSERERREVILEAKKIRRRVFDRLKNVELAQRAYVRWIINHLFKFDDELRRPGQDLVAPKWRIKVPPISLGLNIPEVQAAFHYTEETWTKLTRLSPAYSRGSLLPSPFPVVVAGGRFREAYYWDAYFGALGLLETGRGDLAAAQLENFLHMIQTFGKIPNGFRDYYHTRSQPPVVSLMALAIYDHAVRENKIAKAHLDRWLLERVYPLLRHDYQNFWMQHRLDAETGLSFYSDDANEMRPERHANDDDRELGETFRDVRAQAESGLDHTEALMERTSRVASVSLNAFLYQYENDLARMASMAGDLATAELYKMSAARRQQSVNKYLWDADYGVYRNYDMAAKKQADVVHADMFAALYVKMDSREQAELVKERSRVWLEKPGGLASSTSQSGKQWDGNHGWAPLHVMAIQGLHHYGHRAAAHRLARKWVSSVAKVHGTTGTFYEKIDVMTAAPPVEDGTKYPTQTGFLWTNASFVWALKFLGLEFTPL